MFQLIVLAWLPTASASSEGRMVYNPSCFQSHAHEERRLYAIPPNRGGRGGPMPAAPTMAPAMESAADDSFAGPPAPPPPPQSKKRQKAKDWSPTESYPFRDLNFDWGGTTWLSNDDSMSLASAQRLLWAVERGQPIQASQIRPHELLNYFSFDTEQPRAGETFEVTASAQAHGDTLAVAFAVQGASPERQPLDLSLVLDRSCSMQEDGRMEYTKRGLRKMTDQLHQGDRLDVVLFDNSVCTPLENYVVGRDDPAVLQRVIDQIHPEGGTDLDRGLREGYAVATRKSGTRHRNRRVMLITDALLNAGDVNPHTVSEIGKSFEDHNIRLTGIGVGWSFNDEVLNRLTEKGKGAYVFLGSEAVVDRVFGSGFNSMVQTIAHDVRFQLDLPDSLALQRFYGEEASTHKEDIQPIHYYAGTSQLFLQDLRIAPGGYSPSDPVKLAVSWRDARTGEPEKRVFHTTVGAMLKASPHNVQKAQALMAWTDVLSTRALGGDGCGAPLRAYQRKASGLNDAEISYVSSLITKQCGVDISEEPIPHTEPVTLKLQINSDIPIAEVVASCTDGVHRDQLSPSDNVARFDVEPGPCTLTFQGTVPMRTSFEVANTNTDIRCLIRGGRLECL